MLFSDCTGDNAASDTTERQRRLYTPPPDANATTNDVVDEGPADRAGDEQRLKPAGRGRSREVSSRRGHFAEAPARGTPHRGRIALTVAADVVRELV